MEGLEKTWLERLNLWRIADAADQKFVELGRFLLNLTTGQYHYSVQPSRRTPSAAADVRSGAHLFSALAEQVDRILKRGSRAGREFVAARSKSNGAQADEEVRRWIRQLFHEDPRRRMAAARWIRERRHGDAIPTLESVLSIEEDGDVRAEILCTLRELGRLERPGKGESRCSRSSAE